MKAPQEDRGSSNLPARRYARMIWLTSLMTILLMAILTALVIDAVLGPTLDNIFSSIGHGCVDRCALPGGD